MTTATATPILTDDQLRRLVPSAFAAAPWQAMSHRYRMVPIYVPCCYLFHLMCGIIVR